MKTLLQMMSLVLSVLALGAGVLALIGQEAAVILMSLAVLSLSLAVLLALLGAFELAVVQAVVGTLGSVGLMALALRRLGAVKAPPARLGLRTLDQGDNS